MAIKERKELLPCPFCGGTNLCELGYDGLVFIGCHTCATCGPSGEDEEQAAELWNRRAENGK